MSHNRTDKPTAGLSEAQKRNSEIDAINPHRTVTPSATTQTPIQIQLDSITQRLADLTEIVLRLDRQISPLVEIVRLSHRKSELLNQRLESVIDALKKGCAPSK
ncbi:MAG: hypothetical protein WBY88_03595 [Desulfosarcina sp.]